MHKVADEIWIFEQPFRLFGANFGNRMTVIRLPGGRLMVHSPISLSLKDKTVIDSIGEVTDIITPCCSHGMYVDEWMSAYPEAAYYAVEGLRVRPEHHATILKGDVLEQWQPELEVHNVKGVPWLNESVFFHAPSKTLILTDLAFNIPADHALMTRLFFKLNGAYQRFGPTRLFGSMVRDRKALVDSLHRILEWDFEQIILSHGDIVTNHAVETFKKGFEHYLSGDKFKPRWVLLPNFSRCG